MDRLKRAISSKIVQSSFLTATIILVMILVGPPVASGVDLSLQYAPPPVPTPPSPVNWWFVGGIIALLTTAGTMVYLLWWRWRF